MSAAFPGSNNVHQPGMELRDYFAAAALTALPSNWRGGDLTKGMASDAAEWAYWLADAMMKERKK